MPSLPAFRREVVVALFLGVVATAAAEEAVQVTKLRTPKVTLFDCKDGSKKADYAQKDFQAPWPVLAASGPLADADEKIRETLGKLTSLNFLPAPKETVDRILDQIVGKTVDLLGSEEPIRWEQTAEGLVVTLPVARPTPPAGKSNRSVV